MDSREFLDTADRLSQGTTEGDWRSSMSRSYYAVFHYFRLFLERHGLNLGRGGQSHFDLSVGLVNCGIPPIAAIAKKIDDLRQDRIYADYDLKRTFDDQDAVDNVKKARKLIADFQILLKTTSAIVIVTGVRNYLQSIGHWRPTP